jgi:hypothetical protein
MRTENGRFLQFFKQKWPRPQRWRLNGHKMASKWKTDITTVFPMKKSMVRGSMGLPCWLVQVQIWATAHAQLATPLFLSSRDILTKKIHSNWWNKEVTPNPRREAIAT